MYDREQVLEKNADTLLSVTEQVLIGRALPVDLLFKVNISAVEGVSALWINDSLEKPHVEQVLLNVSKGDQPIMEGEVALGFFASRNAPVSLLEILTHAISHAAHILGPLNLQAPESVKLDREARIYLDFEGEKECRLTLSVTLLS